MSKIRVTVRITKEGKGVSLAQLTGVLEEVGDFLGMLASDIDLEPEPKDWLAIGARPQSFVADIEYPTTLPEEKTRQFGEALYEVVSYQNGVSQLQHASPGTIRQYARIGRRVAPNQSVKFSFKRAEGDREWGEITSHSATAIESAFPETIQYRGFLQGIIHALYKESSPPYFQLRSLQSGDLAKCFYSPDKYKDVVALLNNKTAVVMVSGLVKAGRFSRKVESLDIERMEATSPLSEEEFERFFGSAPGLTGNLSTEDFLERISGGDDIRNSNRVCANLQGKCQQRLNGGG